MTDSRLPGFYRLDVVDRIDALERGGWLSAADADALRDGRQVLALRSADKMIENVVGTFGLPLAV
ncbi:MAG: 3-hydroxy-3-methylglutaryl-CoA reductase, partial [Woeseiaceae bacterium]|nr:3-hydroxy-3-methylglutaryl-CoA reductase [Woeseiaceae bacterium]